MSNFYNKGKPPHYWTKAKKILSRKDKVMKKLIDNYKDGNLITRNDVFFSLCKSIIGQQISVAAANSVFLKFKKKCKNKINARTVNKLSFNSLKSCGLSKQKVKGKNCQKIEIYHVSIMYIFVQRYSHQQAYY